MVGHANGSGLELGLLVAPGGCWRAVAVDLRGVERVYFFADGRIVGGGH